jgi:hypothetical protein
MGTFYAQIATIGRASLLFPNSGYFTKEPAI